MRLFLIVLILALFTKSSGLQCGSRCTLKARPNICAYLNVDNDGSPCAPCCDGMADTIGCENAPEFPHCKAKFKTHNNSSGRLFEAALQGRYCTRECQAPVHDCGDWGDGNCCPNDNGVFMPCCRNGYCQAPQSQYCKTGGLDGYCCPTNGGTYLECCKSKCKKDAFNDPIYRNCKTKGDKNGDGPTLACSCDRTCGRGSDAECCESKQDVYTNCEFDCTRSCYSNTKPWSEKCGWDECYGCFECVQLDLEAMKESFRNATTQKVVV